MYSVLLRFRKNTSEITGMEILDFDLFVCFLLWTTERKHISNIIR